MIAQDLHAGSKALRSVDRHAGARKVDAAQVKMGWD